MKTKTTLTILIICALFLIALPSLLSYEYLTDTVGRQGSEYIGTPGVGMSIFQNWTCNATTYIQNMVYYHAGDYGTASSISARIREGDNIAGTILVTPPSVPSVDTHLDASPICTYSANFSINWTCTEGNKYTTEFYGMTGGTFLVCQNKSNPYPYGHSLFRNDCTYGAPPNCDQRDLPIYFYGTIAPSPKPLTIIMNNSFDRSPIKTFNATIYNSTWSNATHTTTGAATFNMWSGIYTINITIPNYYESFKQTTYTMGLNAATLYNTSIQSLTQVYAYEVVTNNSLSSFSATNNYQSNTTAGSSLLLITNNTQQTINARKTGYINATATTTATIGTINSALIYLGTNNLLINATNINSLQKILSFSSYIESWNSSYKELKSTTTGDLNFSLIAGNYTVTFSATNHENKSVNLTIGSELYTNYSFAVNWQNTLQLQIFDEKSGIHFSIINKTVDISLTHVLAGTKNYSTANGNFTVSNLSLGEYRIYLSAADYAPRYYFVTFAPQTSISLYAYLMNLSLGEYDIITVKDEADNLLENVSVTIYKQINASWVPVEQTRTDGTGKGSFFMDTTIFYLIAFEKEGFTTKSTLLRALPDATGLYRQTFILTPTSAISFETVEGKFAFQLSPASSSINASIQNFSFFTTSGTGSITYFCIYSNYSGAMQMQNITTQPAGGTASILINLTNATGRNVLINYCAKISGLDEWHNDMLYYVSGAQVYINGSAASYFPDVTGQRSRKELSIWAVIVILIFTVMAAFILSGAEAGYGTIFGTILSMIFGWLNPWLGFLLIVIVAAAYRFFMTERYEVR